MADMPAGDGASLISVSFSTIARLLAPLLKRMHEFILPGGYLVVEDSEVKRAEILKFLSAAN